MHYHNAAKLCRNPSSDLPSAHKNLRLRAELSLVYTNNSHQREATENGMKDWDEELGCRDWDEGTGIQELGCRDWDAGIGMQGLGCRDWDAELGCRDWDAEIGMALSRPCCLGLMDLEPEDLQTSLLALSRGHCLGSMDLEPDDLPGYNFKPDFCLFLPVTSIVMPTLLLQCWASKASAA